MSKRAFLGMGVAAVLAASLLLAACGNDDDNDIIAPPGAPDNGNDQVSLSVSIVDFGYEPDTLRAQAGQTIVLEVTNDGDAPHDFTIDGVIEGATLSGGDSEELEFTVAQAGDYTFYCTVHGESAMSGTLQVSN